MQRWLPALALVALMSLITFAAAPGSVAQATPATQNLIGVYADDPAVTFQRPDVVLGAEAEKKVSLCTQPASCRGPVTAAVAFTEADNPLGTAFTINSDLVATVWLSATQAVPLQGLKVDLVINGVGTPITSFTDSVPVTPMLDSGSRLAQIGTTPTKFVLAGTPPVTPVQAAHKFNLRVQANTVGAEADGSPLNVFLHYGSAAHASGVVFGVDTAAGAQRLGNCPLRISLAEEALELGYPMGAESKTRLGSPDGPNPPPVNAVLGQGAAVEWGSIVAPATVTVVSDASFNVTLRLAADAEAGDLLLGVGVNLFIGPQRINGSSQVVRIPDTVADAPGEPAEVTIRMGVPTAGLVIEKDRTLTVSLEIYAANQVGGFDVVYGSRAHPSGFLMAVEAASACGGAPAPTSTSASPTPTTTFTSAASTTTTVTTEASEDPERAEPQSLGGKDIGQPAPVPGPGLVALLAGVVGAGVLLRRRG